MPVPNVVPIKNKDGTYSSEYTIGVSDPRLNNGRETVIPTIVAGRVLSRKEAVEAAVKSGLYYRSFDSIELANEYASKRSDTGGATAHGFAGKEMPEEVKLNPSRKLIIQNQLNKAKMLLRGEENANRGTSKKAYHANRIIMRSERILGIKKAGPKKSPPKKETKRGSMTDAPAKSFKASEIALRAVAERGQGN